MTENGGPSTEEIVEDENEKYNYYECKYCLIRSHSSANQCGTSFPLKNAETLS